MFDEKYASFEVFGASHIAAIVISFVIVALYLIYIKRVRLDRFYEMLIGALMLLTEAVFLVWQFRLYSPGVEHLPLNLCTMSLYINAIALISGERKFTKYTAFFSLVGALIAIVVPMQGYTFPHFRYIHYYLNHLLIALSSIYFLRDLPRITYREMLRAECAFFIFVLTVINGINTAAGTNFMFLSTGKNYFHTVIAPKNLLIYASAIAVHELSYLVYSFIYKYNKNKNKKKRNA